MTVFKTSLKLKSKTYSSKQLGSIKESDFFKNVFCYWILYQRTKDEKKNSHRSPLVCAHIYTIIDRKKRHSCRFTAAHVKHFWSRRDLTWRCGAFQGTGSVGDIVCLKEKYVKQWKHTVTSLPFLSWSSSIYWSLWKESLTPGYWRNHWSPGESLDASMKPSPLQYREQIILRTL